MPRRHDRVRAGVRDAQARLPLDRHRDGRLRGRDQSARKGDLIPGPIDYNRRRLRWENRPCAEPPRSSCCLCAAALPAFAQVPRTICARTALPVFNGVNPGAPTGITGFRFTNAERRNRGHGLVRRRCPSLNDVWFAYCRDGVRRRSGEDVHAGRVSRWARGP